MKDRKLHLPYLVAALERASFEGSLTLLEGDARRILYFRKGKLTNVVSGLQEETLGRILLDEGALSAEQYQELLDGMIRTHRPCGEVLVTMGAMSPQGVFAALERQVAKKLLRCFRMVDFGFALAAEPVPIHQLISTIEISLVLYPAILEGYPGERLVQEFPVHEETRFKTRELPREPVLRLGSRETRVYRDIGAGATLGSLIKTKDKQKEILAALYALHALRLVEAAGIRRPSIRDLGLASLHEEWIGEQGSTLPPRPGAAPGGPAEAEPEPPEPPEAPDGPVEGESPGEAARGEKMSAFLARKALSISRTDYFTLLEIERHVKGQGLKNAFFRLLRTYRLQNIDQAYVREQDRDMARALLDRATIAYRELLDEQRRKEYLATLLKPGARTKPEVPTRILADVEAQKGELALAAKRYDEAAGQFQKALELHPDEPSYHFLLGLTAYKKLLEDPAPAEGAEQGIRGHLHKALKLNPRYDQPRLYLGYLAKREGDLPGALREFKAALKANPENTLAAAEIRHLQRKLKPR